MDYEKLFNDINERKKLVEEHNKQYEPENWVVDGKTIQINDNWIVDSEYMNFVYHKDFSFRIARFIMNKLIKENNAIKQKLSKYEVVEENKNVVEVKEMEDIKIALKNEVKYYKNIDGTFKLDDDGNKIPKKPRTDKTINDYMNILKRAGITDVSHLNKLNDVDAMVKNVEERVSAITSQRLQYTAFIAVLEALNLFPDALLKYRKLQEEGNKQYTEANASTTLSKKQEEQFATKKDFDAMVSKMEENITLTKTPNLDDKRKLQDLILIKLYQKFPVRNEIATLLKLTKKEYDELETKNKNYLVIDGAKMFLSLNDYKTNDTYGENLLKIPMDIKKLFKEWFKFYNEDVKYVFMNMSGEPITTNYLTKQLQRITKEGLGKSISTTMIRKIYASQYAKKNKKQKEDAKMMGHSVSTQNSVYVKEK